MKQIINKTRYMVLGLLLLLSGCGADVGLDQYGEKVPAGQLSDQWLIVNYWAQWCAPCRIEIPELNQLAQQLEGQAVSVLGVNFDGLQGDALRKASEDMQIGFRVLATDPAPRFGIERAQVLPVTYLISPDGELQATLPGEQTADGLREKLVTLGAIAAP